MAVGQKETDDSNVFEIPNEQIQGLWTRNLLHIKRRLSPVNREIKGAPLLLRKALSVIAEPLRYWDFFRGLEDLRYPGSWKVLELPPEKPNIVNCHNLHGGYFDLRSLPWLSHQVPVVLTLHDAWLLSGHCAHSFECERWRTGCGSCPNLTIYPAIWRDATAYNWQRKKDLYSGNRIYVATPSQWLMNKVDQSILAPAILERRVIHNGVDLSVFQPGDKAAARRTLGLPRDLPILLFVGQRTKKNQFKDYATMESALRKVATKSNEQELLFLCLGGASKDKPIGKARVRFVDYQHDLAKVVAFYQAADIYLHAARADTFPNTILEALACGTPVIATAVGGIPEQIEDGVTGFLTPPADPEAMAARIEQLLVDAELRQIMGSKAAEVARERFSLDIQADAYLEWFQEIVSKWQPAKQE
jgi:glycosyltransferase involved in cell wall biosynthesis